MSRLKWFLTEDQISQKREELYQKLDVNNKEIQSLVTGFTFLGDEYATKVDEDKANRLKDVGLKILDEIRGLNKPEITKIGYIRQFPTAVVVRLRDGQTKMFTQTPARIITVSDLRHLTVQSGTPFTPLSPRSAKIMYGIDIHDTDGAPC